MSEFFPPNELFSCKEELHDLCPNGRHMRMKMPLARVLVTLQCVPRAWEGHTRTRSPDRRKPQGKEDATVWFWEGELCFSVCVLRIVILCPFFTSTLSSQPVKQWSILTPFWGSGNRSKTWITLPRPHRHVSRAGGPQTQKPHFPPASSPPLGLQKPPHTGLCA